MLIGNLGRDPEVKELDFGRVVNCSIATKEKWTDKATGEKKERTDWHNLVFFGKIADIAMNYLKKGAKVYVCGESTTTEYTDKDGIQRKATRINVKELEMLDRPPQQQQQPGQQQQTWEQRQQKSHAYRQPALDEVPF